jgi:cytochrome bd ubiquinol oxidase subunit I
VDAVELVLASAAENLFPARLQMALSLGWHIVFACFGIAFPALVVFAEWRGLRRGDPALTELAHTWAKAMGVLFAAGAVSGTLLSFETGILWPGLMDRFGEVYGFPFVLEGFAFFIEAIFVGIYLFGWNRMSPRAHMLSAVPMVIAGIAGAFFVIAANAWMNNPVAFRLDAAGNVVDGRPWAAMLGPSTWPQFVHMWLAAFMVTGFLVASVYAVGMLRGRRDHYHRCGLLIPLTVAAIATPVQIGVGDWIANTVAANQPAKLAAMEAQFETQAGAGLSIGGIYRDDELHYAVEIPYALSLLIHHDPNGVVPGLEEVPPDERPPVNIVHLAYNAMIGIGFALLALMTSFGSNSSSLPSSPPPRTATRGRRAVQPPSGNRPRRGQVHEGRVGRADRRPGYGSTATISRYSSSVNARSVSVVTLPAEPIASATLAAAVSSAASLIATAS